MNELSREQSELLAKYVPAVLDRQQKAAVRLNAEIQRTKISQARVQGRDYSFVDLGGFAELVENEMELRGLSYSEAAARLAHDHPDLYEKYRSGVSNA